ncbi:unnamed protein product [Darwinula stevensoni]|uniref:Uncharacterized protein n=1 Tax=Darwinula stevensoni TaxID=69355 RepID=A0A7R9A1T9_9CRUS|nr:unnamed protein product [Darwinula stevensoni]CAG0878589.1 unnamed protein product [Darwinula stevensoni]
MRIWLMSKTSTTLHASPALHSCCVLYDRIFIVLILPLIDVLNFRVRPEWKSSSGKCPMSRKSDDYN